MTAKEQVNLFLLMVEWTFSRLVEGQEKTYPQTALFVRCATSNLCFCPLVSSEASALKWAAICLGASAIEVPIATV